MTNFSYKVKNQKGEIEQGSITATSITDAAIKLERNGFIVLEIRETNDNSFIHSECDYSVNWKKCTV